MKVERALISVSNKSGIVEFARGLKEFDVEIISTGGTARLLKENEVDVVEISEVTGFPEMLSGRVKTLHPFIFAGILARRDDPEHMRQLQEKGIKKIDMVVVNLYPFKETVLKHGSTIDEIIENIDIGGPSMIRAAAKNFDSVAVITNPRRYNYILEEMRKTDGAISKETLKALMVEAYRTTGVYDAMISNYFGREFGQEVFPDNLVLGFEKALDLRYGENPNQSAAFYVDPFATGVCISRAEKLHGKELSYNNILDLEAALDILRDFDRPTVAVLKHTNPCGIASADNIHDAFVAAYNVDPVAAFGCVIGINREVDDATAEEIGKHFVEAVIAPSYTPGALSILEKKKNIRILRTNAPITPDERPELKMKKIKGGLLAQTYDYVRLKPEDLKVVTKRKPTDFELKSMLFAWKVVKHVWSNAIVLAKDERVVGIGAGQMSRVDSSMIAAFKAKEDAKGSVMASDAFFPFRDGVDEAAKAGVTAIIQPGGSVRDDEVIKAADEHGMAMVFTGIRVFRH
ncbi:MAG: bifunctional phosphoribosylaminoimidazolecarboxamide formyltransferase/IMP cyclohydrolase [Methanomassiliicoccales archaeon]|jgi:phosphoribosylaminoimidazolecarboxamide formyltransferase/IMP cyclohydrolase|nr:bifunctional phosphoribosylaminoimidazolecarboxamide formyltransferase/IMP cyclohydrolase [Methanomassiliicoccales archaeon]